MILFYFQGKIWFLLKTAVFNFCDYGHSLVVCLGVLQEKTKKFAQLSTFNLSQQKPTTEKTAIRSKFTRITYNTKSARLVAAYE